MLTCIDFIVMNNLIGMSNMYIHTFSQEKSSNIFCGISKKNRTYYVTDLIVILKFIINCEALCLVHHTIMIYQNSYYFVGTPLSLVINYYFLVSCWTSIYTYSLNLNFIVFNAFVYF